jgi:hypothetical protein
MPGPNDIVRRAELGATKIVAPMVAMEEAVPHTNEHRGFAFSAAEHQDSSNAVSQVDLIRRYSTASMVKPTGE